MEAADAGRTLVLVDAANVMGSRPDGWWRDRVAAVNRLLDELQAWAIGHPGDVVVIVEGVVCDGIHEGVHGGVEVRHATRKGIDAADDRIVELVRAASHLEVEVVTADRELRRRVVALGAQVTGPRSLFDRL
ncbi:MAG: NTP pyrophosphohydrolase [Nitriliruptor sp.]|nr:MAG: NTP pyrophosphohydrolase [Nitriliruptor sp.]